jgi:hypothetical protein
MKAAGSRRRSARPWLPRAPIVASSEPGGSAVPKLTPQHCDNPAYTRARPDDHATGIHAKSSAVDIAIQRRQRRWHAVATPHYRPVAYPGDFAVVVDRMGGAIGGAVLGGSCLGWPCLSHTTALNPLPELHVNPTTSP